MYVFANLERTLARILVKDAQNRMQQQALHIAMARFGKLHPTWHESLFDETFVRRVFAVEEAEVDAPTLAREWTRQFRYRDPRQRERDVRQLEPIAESYLRLLAEAETEVDPSRKQERAPATGSSSSHHTPEPSPC